MRQEIENFYTGLSNKVKLKIRKKAETNAIQQAIRYGRRADEYSVEEWRIILKEEEDTIIKNIWRKGSMGLLSFTLFPWLWL